MTLVTIHGNAWTHQGRPIPAELRPRLKFFPKAHSFGGGALLVGVEARADLDLATGQFTVEVESEPGLLYQPRMEWFPGLSDETGAHWAEWPFLIAPGNGGLITDLIGVFPPGTILVGLGAPPSGVAGVAWIDITDQTEEGALVYAPEGSA